MQETNRCYGPFKTQFAINLDDLVDARLKKDTSVSLQPKLVGLPVFGGYDAQSEFNIEVSAFQQGFNRDMCVSAWEKVGAATKDGITRRCLEDKKVKRLVADGDKEADELHPLIQIANDLAIHALMQAGYNGELLRATIKEDKQTEAEKIITEPNTAARVAALVNAKMHGARFHATHGTHSTSEDIMKSVELSKRMVLREKLLNEKKLCLQQQTLEDKVKLILDAGKNVELLLVSELDTLLAWH